MADIVDGGVGDQSSGSQGSTDQSQTGQQGTPPAGAQNTGQNPPAEPNVPFHKHPRWIERETRWNNERTQLNSTITGLTKRIEAMERTAQAVQAGTATPEEQQALVQAAAALKRVLAADPELKAWFESRVQIPKLVEGYQGVQTLTDAQSKAQLVASRNHVSSLATKMGIEVTPKNLPHIIRLVAGAAMQLPNGPQRFESGDMGVLDEAFETVKEFLEALKKPGQTQVLNTKLKTQKLPPRPAGSAAGPAAPPKLEPGKEKEFEAGMHQRARALLEQM